LDHFNYKGDSLYCEDVAISTLAETYGTPLYVYSRATLERHWHAFDDALAGREHLICYAVKANSNIAVLNVLARLGSGFDIVSSGELQRVLRAGGDPSKIVFSGVGKQAHEMALALDTGIHCFNVESEQELDLLNQVAADKNLIAAVSFRVNPNVDAKTHPYISTGLKENKFGIAFDDAERIYLKANQLVNIDVIGIDCHIGSQLTELSPFIDALTLLLALVNSLNHMDLGGGLGIRYQDETPPLPSDWASALSEQLSSFEGTIVVEPGRAIAGNAGILVSQVNYLKLSDEKNFAIVDAAMNDLIRPALYSAWQDIIPVQLGSAETELEYDIVGAICETGDFLGKNRVMKLAQNDLLAVRSSGAYGFAMASNYNTRNRAAEVMVDGDQHYCIRQRETFDEQISGESLLPV
jgi:diaminopimelate decarboxylase